MTKFNANNRRQLVALATLLQPLFYEPLPYMSCITTYPQDFPLSSFPVKIIAHYQVLRVERKKQIMLAMF